MFYHFFRFAEVWLVKDKKSKRQLALKQIPAKDSDAMIIAQKGIRTILVSPNLVKEIAFISVLFSMQKYSS
jgi:hypothetical protein